MEKEYNQPQNLTDEQRLDRRLSGVLPVIDIMGYPFIIDWRLRELRLQSDTSIRLDLKSMPMSSDGDKYLCYYHPPTYSEFVADKNIRQLPKDVVLLEIPYELILDPVAVARQYGLADTELLDRFPIRQEIKATAVPLEQSYLAELVKNNQARSKKSTIRKPHKTRKGKGL